MCIIYFLIYTLKNRQGDDDNFQNAEFGSDQTLKRTQIITMPDGRIDFPQIGFYVLAGFSQILITIVILTTFILA